MGCYYPGYKLRNAGECFGTFCECTTIAVSENVIPIRVLLVPEACTECVRTSAAERDWSMRSYFSPLSLEYSVLKEGRGGIPQSRFFRKHNNNRDWILDSIEHASERPNRRGGVPDKLACDSWAM